MENNEAHKALEEGNMAGFINMHVTKYQKSIVISERDRCITVRENIEKELYKNFLENSEGIIEILNTYNEISLKSEDYNSLVTMYNELLSNLKFKNKTLKVDENKQRELFEMFDRFEDDMSYFKSVGRYLVHYDVLDDFLLIMTNDLVFIAENKSLPSLLHVVNYNSLRMRMSKDRLILKSDSFKYELHKDENSLVRILGVFEERNGSEILLKRSEDQEYSEYLIKTEQYDKLEEEEHHKEILVYTEDELLSVMNRMDDSIKNEFLVEFLKSKFKSAIQHSKKIQKLDCLVKDCFSIFSEFKKEQDLLIDRCKLYNFEPFKLCLMEEEISIVFKFLEKRMLFSFDNSKAFEDIISCLVAGGFGYMADRVNKMRCTYKKISLESAKNRLTDLINDI